MSCIDPLISIQFDTIPHWMPPINTIYDMNIDGSRYDYNIIIIIIITQMIYVYKRECMVKMKFALFNKKHR